MTMMMIEANAGEFYTTCWRELMSPEVRLTIESVNLEPEEAVPAKVTTVIRLTPGRC